MYIQYTYSDSGNRFSGKFYVDFMPPIFFSNFYLPIKIKSEISIEISKKTGILSLGRGRGPYLGAFPTYFLLSWYKTVNSASGAMF